MLIMCLFYARDHFKCVLTHLSTIIMAIFKNVETEFKVFNGSQNSHRGSPSIESTLLRVFLCYSPLG